MMQSSAERFLTQLMNSEGLDQWDKFCEVDVFEIYPRAESEPYYCSVAGMFEETFSMSVYKGHIGPCESFCFYKFSRSA